MIKINRYLTMGIMMVIIGLLVIGCQPTPKALVPSPQPAPPAVTVPKPVESPAPTLPTAPAIEEAQITQTGAIQSEIENTNKISGIEDTESVNELDNLDVFVEKI